MLMTCGYKWQAPYLLPPPSKKVIGREQICHLPKNHKGDHRSLTKVTAPNKKES